MDNGVRRLWIFALTQALVIFFAEIGSRDILLVCITLLGCVLLVSYAIRPAGGR